MMRTGNFALVAIMAAYATAQEGFLKDDEVDKEALSNGVNGGLDALVLEDGDSLVVCQEGDVECEGNPLSGGLTGLSGTTGRLPVEEDKDALSNGVNGGLEPLVLEDGDSLVVCQEGDVECE